MYRVALRHRHSTMIFQNPQDRADMLQHVGLPGDNTVLIPGSGVDLGAFPPAARGGPVPVVVMASRLLADKGVREYVAACTTLRNRGVAARFLLAGTTDPANPTTVTDAEVATWRAAGVIEVLGQRGDIPALFASADLVVLPSYREGLPKVLAEAAAAGCAVVTTDVPGCRDAIIPDRSGLLVPPADAGALADAIGTLVMDRERCARLGAAGRALARERFSLDAVIAQHLDVYAALFAAR